MKREEIIEKLQKSVSECENLNEDMNVTSWGYENGVLITGNQAQDIINLLSLPPTEGATAEEFIRARYYMPKELPNELCFFHEKLFALMEEFAAQRQPHPIAEGAEMPDAKKYLSDNGYGNGTNYTTSAVAGLMQAFATLTADKGVEERLSIPHKCERIAIAPAMGEGRDWWIGRILEPIEKYPEETHCLHMTTPMKSVVFLCNIADFRNLMIICRLAAGQPNESWMQSMMRAAKINLKSIEK